MARTGKLRAAVAVWVVAAVFTMALSALAAPPLEPGDYVPGQILVKFRPGTPASEVAKAHTNARSAVANTISGIDVQVVKLPPGLSVSRGVGMYQRNPNIEYAEPDYVLEPQTTWPDDPWYLYGEVYLQLIGAGEAWDITRGDPEVMIAVLDSGLAYDHEDVQGRYLLGWDFAYDDADPWDVYGHGTGVYGVVGATTNNGIGIASVSWLNPVLVVKIASDLGYTSSSLLAAGLVYASDAGARAANISYCSSVPSPTMQDAVDYAWNRGTVTVCAAGNYGNDTPRYPAAYTHAIGVSMVSDDVICDTSSYGSHVDLCAPFGIRSLCNDGTYGTWGGTSIAAPFVTGAVSLVASINPDLTASQIVEIIEQSADDLGEPGWDEYYGWGRINLYQAVLAAGDTPTGDTSAPSVTVSQPASGSVVSGLVAIQSVAADDVGVTEVEFYVDGACLGGDAVAPFTWAWDTEASANGEHVLTATAYDAAGNAGESSPVTVIVDNEPPVDVTPPTVAILTPDEGELLCGEEDVVVSAADEVGVVQVDLYLDGALVGSQTAPPYAWTWSTDLSGDGPHTLAAFAYDAAGNAGESPAIGVTVDNGDPWASIIAPADGSAVSGAVVVEADAGDAVELSSVEFFMDGAKQATRAAAPFAWEWDTTTVANGWHTVAARAIDAAGNASDSPPIDVCVENVWVPELQTEVFSGRTGGRGRTASHWVTTLAEGPVTAVLDCDGRVVLDMQVYDASGLLLAADTSSGNPKALELYLPAGEYEFLLGSERWKSKYTLEVTHF